MIDQHRPTGRRAAVHAQMGMRARMMEPAPEVERSDHRIPVDGGEITVRVYVPPDAPGPLPAHVYVHGGGWWLGTLDHGDIACARIAANVGCTVVSVDHRLAPEHPFPAPPEDVYAALLWTAERAPRVSIGGVSSGGNLATIAALMSRDRGGPAPVAQVLDVAPFDLTRDRTAPDEPGLPLTPDDLAEYIGFYVGEDQRAHPYASPALADDLSGLPPTMINVAEYDVLHGDGPFYAQRLADAGVRVDIAHWAGHIHGSHEMTAMLETAREWQRGNEAFLRARLRGQRVV